MSFALIAHRADRSFHYANLFRGAWQETFQENLEVIDLVSIMKRDQVRISPQPAAVVSGLEFAHKKYRTVYAFHPDSKFQMETGYLEAAMKVNYALILAMGECPNMPLPEAWNHNLTQIYGRRILLSCGLPIASLAHQITDQPVFPVRLSDEFLGDSLRLQSVELKSPWHFAGLHSFANIRIVHLIGQELFIYHHDLSLISSQSLAEPFQKLRDIMGTECLELIACEQRGELEFLGINPHLTRFPQPTLKSLRRIKEPLA